MFVAAPPGGHNSPASTTPLLQRVLPRLGRRRLAASLVARAQALHAGRVSVGKVCILAPRGGCRKLAGDVGVAQLALAGAQAPAAGVAACRAPGLPGQRDSSGAAWNGPQVSSGSRSTPMQLATHTSPGSVKWATDGAGADCSRCIAAAPDWAVPSRWAPPAPLFGPPAFWPAPGARAASAPPVLPGCTALNGVAAACLPATGPGGTLLGCANPPTRAGRDALRSASATTALPHPAFSGTSLKLTVRGPPALAGCPPSGRCGWCCWAWGCCCGADGGWPACCAGAMWASRGLVGWSTACCAAGLPASCAPFGACHRGGPCGVAPAGCGGGTPGRAVPAAGAGGRTAAAVLDRCCASRFQGGGSSGGSS